MGRTSTFALARSIKQELERAARQRQEVPSDEEKPSEESEGE